MHYDHVARDIVPGFGGFASSFPATVNIGETHTVNATFVLPAGWEENEMHIIGLLIAPNGSIDNAGKATIAEAVGNGFVTGTPMNASIDEANQLDAMLQVYPNPASDYTTLAINLKAESTVAVRLLDINGSEIAARNYGSMNGASTITVPTAGLAKGVYVVEMTVDSVIARRTLIIE